MRFWANAIIDAIHDDRGRLIGFAKVTRDLTERRQAQQDLEHSREQLVQSQKMEAIGQLTGGIAHDFNNLLTGISGSLELLKTRLAQGRFEDFERYITSAQGAASRAASLTHRLLAFARRQTLDPKPVNANKLISSMEELVRRTVGPAIHIETVLAIGLWPTLCDPNQLENALLNLCINARDAMPDGGRITLETTNSWLDERAARAARHAARAVCRDLRERYRDRYDGRCARPRLRSVLHDEADWAGNGPRSIHGLWLRQAIGRPSAHLFGSGQRHDVCTFICRGTRESRSKKRPSRSWIRHQRQEPVRRCW